MWLFCLLDPFIPTQIKFLATPLIRIIPNCAIVLNEIAYLRLILPTWYQLIYRGHIVFNFYARQQELQ